MLVVVDQHRPGGRLHKAGKDAEQTGLADAASPHQRNDLPLRHFASNDVVDLEGDIPENQRVVSQRDVADLQEKLLLLVLFDCHQLRI